MITVRKYIHEVSPDEVPLAIKQAILKNESITDTRSEYVREISPDEVPLFIRWKLR